MKTTEKLGLAFCSLTGLVLLFFGIYQYDKSQSLIENGIEVPGVVTALRTKGGSFSPVVEFTDHIGVKRLHYSKVSSDPPRFFVGETVNIVYNPRDPKYPVNCRINTTMTMWGTPILLLAMGSTFLVVSTIVWYVLKYRGGVVVFGRGHKKR